MVAAAGPLNRFGGGRHLWLATVPVAESPLNGGLSVANEAQPIFFLQGTTEHEQGGDEEGSWLDDDWVVPQTAVEANEMWGTRGLTGWRKGQERVGIPGEGDERTGVRMREGTRECNKSMS